jgi:hypothetical protein
MPPPPPLAEESTIVAELEFDLGSRQKGVSLTDAFGHRDLALCRNRALHTEIVKK